MATSGYLRKSLTPNGLIYVQLNWSAGTQDIANNTTPITWNYQIVSTNSSASISSTANKKLVISIDGDNVFNGNVSIAINGNATKTLASGTKTIAHNSDGTKNFAMNISQQVDINYSGTDIKTITASGSGSLNTIARATVPTVTGTKSLGSTITINTPRASTNFTHRILYSWGSKVVDQQIATGVTTSTTFTIPKTLANYIPNGTSGTMFIKCDTYNGSTLIGRETISITVSVPNTTEFQPSISGVTLSEANTVVPTAWGVYVQGVSKLQGTVNTTSAYSSTIKSYKIEVNGSIYTTQTFTTEALNTSGTNTIKVTVVDGRGRSKTYSTTFNVVEYGKPYINSFAVTRTSSSAATLRINGGVYAVSNKNTYSYSYKYKPKSSSTYTTVTITNAAYTIDKTINVTGLTDVTYDFVGVIADALNTGDNATQKATSLPTTSKIVNINADGNGMGVFKKSERANAIELAKDVYDKYDTQILNGLAVYEYGGSTDVNTTLEELVLSATNTPTSDFWYVRTMFYNSKTATSNRTQIAYPYNQKDPVYTRYYVNGTGWSEWSATDIISFTKADGSGSVHFANGLLIQWGVVTITPTAANTVTSLKINFPIAYDNTPRISATPRASTPQIITTSVGSGTVAESKTSMTLYMTRNSTAATAFQWDAMGYSKNGI